MKRRYREILNLLYNSDFPISGKDLCRDFGVSLRTIRADIVSINEILKDYDIVIDSQIRGGYRINPTNKQKLKESHLIRQVMDKNYISEIPSTPHDRQMYLILRLTMVDRLIIEELSEYLCVSVSTIMNDIEHARKWLHDRMNLNLSCSLTEGVTLKANEFEKRNIYLWVMSKKINMSTGSKYSNYLFSDNRIMNVFVILNQIIVELGKSHGIFFAGNSVYFFTLCVCIHYQRSINGYLVTGGETDQPYYPFIQSLRQRAIQEFGQDLTEAEWTQIQRCYLSSQFRSASHLQDILTIESERIYNQFVFEVKKHSEINALMMSRNRIKLQSQIATMINRLKYNLPIPNRIDDEAKDSLPRSYGLAELITPIVLRHTGLNVNQIELVYLALYFEVMISQSQPMIKTLLVCDHDESIITYIQHRLALVFEESLVIRQVIGFMEISHEQADLNGIDFIITTSNIADITDFPFVKINPLIDRHDISAIQEQIIKLI